MKHDAIAVIDFGGQYAHLIATKVRAQQVLAEIFQPEDPVELFGKYKGIIISGGPGLSSKDEDSCYAKEIFDIDVPILGLCFGHQEIAKHYGGAIARRGEEWGPAMLHIRVDHPLFKGLNTVEQVWMSHYESVVGLGPGFKEIGYTTSSKGGKRHSNAAIVSDELKRYGLQFHPEVDDTPHGEIMIANFVRDICGCSPTWTMENYLHDKIENIRVLAGDNSVFLLVSGGVDSTVAARLFGIALGPDRLHLLHIDNGLMRKDESCSVIEMFESFGLGSNFHFADAGETFVKALEGVVGPEEKRIIIGNTFVEVFEHQAMKLGLNNYILGQGTIYPDTIETGGTRRADIIKTHHNRVPVIERMMREGRVLEPLSDLYKAEVRLLGRELDIGEKVLGRHPFPGPGFGVRLLCSDGKSNSRKLEKLDREVEVIASRYGLHALSLPVRSVGVKGDLRSYERPVLITGEHDPAGSPHWTSSDLASEEPWERIVEVAGIILQKIKGINRCIWNLSGTIPASVRALSATITGERLNLLREIDHIVMNALVDHGVYDSIWQCPTVMVPLEIDGRGTELVIIRPVHSKRAMTASPARLPEELISELCDRILAFDAVSGLCLDVTSKPPGTIEWE